MHVGGLIQVPRCFLMMNILFMQLGICGVPKYLDVIEFVQPHTLLQCQLDHVEILRSSDHVLQSLCRRREGKHGRHHVFSRWQGSIVFESPVLGLAKDCNQTGLRPNKTKTKKDRLLVFCSLGFGLFILEKSKRPKKTRLNWSFLGQIMYILTTILGLFLVILSYFFWNLFM